MNSLKSIGVINKLIAKVEYLNKEIKDVEAVFFLEEDAASIPAEFQRSFIRWEIATHDWCKLLEKQIQNHSDYSLILMRYPGANQSLFKFMKHHSNKIVFEHNTKETDELWLLIRSYTIRDWLYLLKNGSLLAVLNVYFTELKYGKKILQLAKAGIAVTQEIADYESKRANGLYRTQVISNGVDVNSIAVRKAPAWDGNTMVITMICSSANANQWQGVDRIVNSVIAYSGNTKIILNLIGAYHHELVNRVSSHTDRIRLHGYMNRSEMQQIMSDSHLGVGSLALHRIPLIQGAVLKVREYMAMGLPFMIAYDDVDVPADYPYCLKVKADEKNIEMKEVIRFCELLYKNDFSAETMRRESLPLIDAGVKMNQFVKFIKSL